MLWDITPPISPQLATWPGDTPLRREVLLEMSRGDAVTLSALHATVHLGAHADAPSHYGAGAPAIHERPLDLYLGRCQVIRVPVPCRTAITPALLPGPIRAERVLLATGTYRPLEPFTADFAALTSDLVESLHRQGVRLIGIDTPSVDLFDAADLPVHRTFLRLDMAILEGLILDGVPEGLYELIALPLPLVGFEASPVRAVLRDLAD